jgi:stringent starvation protein B
MISNISFQIINIFIILFCSISFAQVVVNPPFQPSPPLIIYPTLYFKLYPKTSVTVGKGGDVNFSDMKDVMSYFDFLGNGGKIKVLPGTYVYGEQIVLGSNMEFRGSGMNNTIIKLANNASYFADIVSNEGFIKASGANNIIISDITLDGNYMNQSISKFINNATKKGVSGISTIGCNNILIDKVKTINFQIYGMVPHGILSSNVYGKQVTIRNSVSENNLYDGINIYAYTNVTIINNSINNNGRHGISSSESTSYLMIRNNSMFNNGFETDGRGCSINIRDDQNTTKNIIIDSNFMYNSSSAGICLENATYVQVNKNNVLIAPRCMIFEYTNKTIVNNNTCIKTANKIVVDSNSEVVQYQNIYSDSLIGQSPMYITAGYTETANIVLKVGEDCVKQLQLALDQIAFNGVGTLELFEGTYIVSKYLQLSSNVVFKGQGIDKTTIKLIDNSQPFVEGTKKTSGVVNAYTSDNIEVIGMTIDGNKENQLQDELHAYGKFGFFIQACNNVTVDSVRITNFQGYGFDPHGWKDAGIYGTYLYIRNCVADNNDWDGYALDQTNHINVTNSIADNNGRHGFNIVTGSKYVHMSNCSASGNGYYYPSNPGAGGCGVIVQNGMNFGTSYVIIEDVFVSNSTRGGICANDVHNIEYRRNTIQNSTVCMNFAMLRNSSINNNDCNYTYKNMTLFNVTNTSFANNTWIPVPTSNAFTPSMRILILTIGIFAMIL